ncbi:MAG: hypothetical protein JSR85_00065 [Proteobacteria bacterium]|nr:hypothetical protein [Pseudomonadota bacterium]
MEKSHKIIIRKLSIVLCSLAFFAYASSCFALQTDEALNAAAARYITFLNAVGKLGVKSQGNNLPALFTSDLKKIMNGKLAFASLDKFSPQLESVYNAFGPWTIENLDTIISSQQNTCVVRYVLKSAQGGNFTTIGILRFDDKGLIREINEVYNKFEG